MVKRDKEEKDSKSFFSVVTKYQTLPRNTKEIDFEIEQLAKVHILSVQMKPGLKIILLTISCKFKDTNLVIVALELNEEEVLASLLTPGQTIG